VSPAATSGHLIPTSVIQCIAAIVMTEVGIKCPLVDAYVDHHTCFTPFYIIPNLI